MAYSVNNRNFDINSVPNTYVATPIADTLNVLTMYDDSSDVRFLAVEGENIALKERVLILETEIADMRNRLKLVELWISQMN